MAPLFVLQETSSGYALLKARDKKLLSHEDLASETETAEGICSLLKLKEFRKFDSAATALEEVSALLEGKVTPKLAALLDSMKDEKKVSLAVADPKLGNAINKLPGLTLTPISDSTTADLYRAIREHLPSLIPGLMPQDISTMSLGLSHSLSRHKLKFSPDKVDTMIVQAIALLDDLDKELNMYAMRVKEWYGWHFPEMARIINDNLAYARVILSMGMRTNAAHADLAEVLPEEIETAVKAAAEVSMGTEITTQDLDNIQALAEQVVGFTEYRQQLSSYLSARMSAIAPNLTTLVGDLVGARLIAHAGSLMNLAKSPASTIQVLGAEKALFRALKTKHDTPKYGLIYHASLIGQATGKNKGKIARMLATKAALGLRVDALADWSAEGEGKGDMATEEEKSALGVNCRLKIERRIAGLEGKPLRPRGVGIAPNGTAVKPGKWELKEARKYNPDADGLAGDEPAAAAPVTKKAKKAKDTPMIEIVEDKAVANGKSSDDKESDSEHEDKDEVEGEVKDEGGAEDGDEDEEMEDEPTAAASIADNTNDVHKDEKSEILSTVSADTPDSPPSSTQQETNWQSSILGNTKEAKKARKKEKHERKLKLSEERSVKKALKNAKLARRLDRKQRRQKREEQLERREEQDDKMYGDMAKKAGLTVARYKRKLERGEIRFNADGTPEAISKKEIKKAREEAEQATHEADATSGKRRKREEAEKATDEVDATSGKKRKREEAGGEAVEKSEKKKKKRSRE
ncbi:nucleolar protein 58 [Lasallia pustulata]|uniref:Nucleolar protein 58 n=1 Tax=Lasallia pustulata TaxID=136370 RepID=A0A1W5CTV0_9LECA|nr:nucleolar protein 58 [Lasallia pustulata]